MSIATLMRNRLSLFLFSFAILIEAIALADAPSAIYIFPAGGQRGAEVQFRFGGYDLHDGCPLEMVGSGIFGSSRTQPADRTIWFEGPVIPLPDSQAQESYPRDHIGQVSIAKDAALGFRKVRVRNSQGVSNWLRFVIGDLPEILENEIDGAPIPVDVQLPVTINGRVFPREDVDIWSFEAIAGKSYTCEVMADRFGSPLDARLIIVGPDGQPIAESEDRFGKDPFVRFTASDNGKYQVKIHDVNFGGLQHFVYRLTITDGTHIESIYPLGGQRGSKVSFQLHGQNVPDTLDAIVSDSATQFSIAGERTNQIQLQVSDFPELLEVEPNDTSQDIAKVESINPSTEAPDDRAIAGRSILNGRIDRPGDVDVWPFAGRIGESYDFDLFGSRLGSRIDSVLSIRNLAGNELASNDDFENGQADSRLVFKAPEDATYEVCVRDRFSHRSGPTFAYRLIVKPADQTPDYELYIAQEVINVPRNGEAKWKVKVVRKNGMTGLIAIDIRDLPDGVTVSGNTIPDKKNETDLVFRAVDSSKITVTEISVIGTAKIGEKQIERVATRPNSSVPENDTDGLPGKSITLAVTVPTPFKIFGQFETKYAARGSTFVRHFSINRGEFKGPITVRLAERQVRHLQGVTGPTIVIPPGVDEFDYPLHLAPWMEIGRTSRTCLMGVGEVSDSDGSIHKVSFTSGEQFDQIIVLVDPGQLALRISRSSVRASSGSEANLTVSVGRGQGITGPVEIDLVSPDHIDCVKAMPLRIESGQISGNLKLKFDGGTLDTFNMPLTIRATAQVKGKSYTAEERIILVAE